MLTSSTILMRFSDLLQVVYYKNAPHIYIIGFFLLGICIANKFGFKSIVKTNFIIVPFIIVSGFILLIGLRKYMSPSGIYPILGNNVKETFVNGSTNIFAFSGITYLFFIMPSLKNKKDFKSIGIIFITISIIIFVLTILALLLVAPFITHSEELLSIYLLVRLAEFGEFLQRTDALFIFLWIISTLSYLSVTIMYVITIFRKNLHLKDSSELCFPLCCIILGSPLLLRNPTLLSFLEEVVYKYYVLILVFGISLLIMILANIKKGVKPKWLKRN